MNDEIGKCHTMMKTEYDDVEIYRQWCQFNYSRILQSLDVVKYELKIVLCSEVSSHSLHIVHIVWSIYLYLLWTCTLFSKLYNPQDLKRCSFSFDLLNCTTQNKVANRKLNFFTYMHSCESNTTLDTLSNSSLNLTSP